MTSQREPGAPDEPTQALEPRVGHESVARAESRIMPHSLEAERSVLGAVLLSPDSLPQVLESLESNDFYREQHRVIFEAMVNLTETRGSVDLMLLTEHLRSSGDLKKVGGVEYLAKLAHSVPVAANLTAHVRLVKAKSVMRHVIEAATRIVEKGYEGQQDFDRLLAEAEQSLLGLAERRTDRTYSSMEEILTEGLSSLERIFDGTGRVAGLASGFVDLDEITTGFHPSDLVIFAGRPAMGKTALGMSIAVNVALRGESVIIFSLEMSKIQLGLRILCAEAQVNSQELRQGKVRRNQWPMLIDAANRLSRLPIYIDDTPALTPRELRAKAKRFARERELKLVLVDYLQLMTDPNVRENRQVEISSISRGLKLIAKELAVPVIALAQLSRSVESRTDKRPILSDLRESGAIEQDADVVGFLYREEYYELLKGRRLEEVSPDIRGVAELIIGKQRNGPTGTVRLAFLENFARFENLSFRDTTARPVEERR
jgi:replicative DNA helicase